MLRLLIFIKQILRYLIVSLLFQNTPAYAVENNFGHRIFQIQKKMALRGSALAQYKLATFYEFGISVEPNLSEAKTWYEISAKKNNEAAKKRLVYLDVKENGFKPSNEQWLKDVKNGADSGKGNDFIILGQLHHSGLAVKKDLQKALSFLQQASLQGLNEVNDEINIIKEKLALKQKQSKPAEPEKTKVVAKVPAKENVQPKPEFSDKTQKKKIPAKKEIIPKKSISKKAKREKYEAAMKKLREENLLLDQQQEWSESTDDE